MVLATGKHKRNASIAKRGIVQMKNNDNSILQRFQQHDTYRESQQPIGWDEDTCRRLDKIESEDHTYIATWYERQRYENSWKLALNTRGKNGPMKGRWDYYDTVTTIRDLRQKDEQLTTSSTTSMEKSMTMEFMVLTGFVFDNGKGQIRGGLLKNEKNICFFLKKKFQEFRLQEMKIPL